MVLSKENDKIVQLDQYMELLQVLPLQDRMDLRVIVMKHKFRFPKLQDPHHQM